MGFISNRIAMGIFNRQRRRQVPHRFFGAVDSRENLLVVGGDFSDNSSDTVFYLFECKLNTAEYHNIPAVSVLSADSPVTDDILKESLNRGSAVFGRTADYDPFISCYTIEDAQYISRFMIESYIEIKSGSFSMNDSAKLGGMMNFFLDLLVFTGGTDNLTLSNILNLSHHLFTCDGVDTFIEAVERGAGTLPESFTQQLSRCWDTLEIFRDFINELERVMMPLSADGAEKHGIADFIAEGRSSALVLDSYDSEFGTAVIFADLMLACRNKTAFMPVLVDLPIVLKRELDLFPEGRNRISWMICTQTLSKIASLPSLDPVGHVVCLGCQNMEDAEKLAGTYTGGYDAFLPHLGIGGGMGGMAAPAGLAVAPGTKQLEPSRLLVGSIRGGAAVLGADGARFYDYLLAGE